MNRNLLAILVDEDDQPGGGIQPKPSHHRFDLVIALFAHDGTIRHLGIPMGFAFRKRGGRFNNFVTCFKLLDDQWRLILYSSNSNNRGFGEPKRRLAPNLTSHINMALD